MPDLPTPRSTRPAPDLEIVPDDPGPDVEVLDVDDLPADLANAGAPTEVRHIDPSRARIGWRGPRPGLPTSAQLRADLISGLLVAVALIPESIAFSIIVGVDPSVGLYASFTIAIVTSVVGGRPALISAATGSMALVVAPLVAEHGIEHLWAVALFTGAIQFVLGALGVGRLMRFIPRTVMSGFVDALAILIFLAQMERVWGESALVWATFVVALAGVYLIPRATSALPAPLIVIVVLTAATMAFHPAVPTVADVGELPSSLPGIGLPDVPLTLDTLMLLLPYAVTLAFVGLLESLLTAQLIDDITDTRSDKDRESRGQGIANVASGLVGGMPGCALVGQSMMNIRAGGRTRVSTLASGVFLLLLVLALRGPVGQIPMAALAAVMVAVCVATFDWRSVAPATLRRTPPGEVLVTAATVAVVVATDNLAYGVLVGVLLSAVMFARRVAHVIDVEAEPEDRPGGGRRYVVRGQLFFASTEALVHAFDYGHPARRVELDLSRAVVWDSSAVAALDAVVARLSARGVDVEVTGLHGPSLELHGRLTGRFSAEG